MKRFSTVFLIWIITLAPAWATGKTATVPPDYSIFETEHQIEVPELKKPTAVSVNLLGDQRLGVAVVEEGNEEPQPWLRIRQHEDESAAINVRDHSRVLGNASAFTDGDYRTSAEFDLDRDKGVAFIELEGERAITSNYLHLSLESHVALPHNISISAWVNEKWKTVVAKKRLFNAHLGFPETTAQRWKINLWHGQPLRLNEITLTQRSNADEFAGVEIRWLARPGKTYTLYSGARLYPQFKTAEKGTLQAKDLEVVSATLLSSNPNPQFKEPDSDEDGIADFIDNCVGVANTKQDDVDDNGRGDACEDFDGDGVVNSKDNCPDHPNRLQEDEDGDKIGDVCDGEESRVTERNPWLPWAAMGITALLVLVIVVQTVKQGKK